MLRTRIASILLALLMLAGSTKPAAAQDYSFTIPSDVVVLAVNTDGTVSIEYTITFKCNDNGHEIDYVDIGLPTTDYKLKNISAEVDGKTITDIEDSPYVSGIALGLGSNAIQPGETGIVHVIVQNLRGMIYEADAQESVAYAGLQFSPNYFGSSYVTGKTTLSFTLLFPAGLSENEPRYYTPSSYWPGSAEPLAKFADDGRIFYQWSSNEANSYTSYIFGASFPASYVDASAIQKEPQTTTDTGSGTTSFNFDNICPWIGCLGTIGFFVLSIYSATIGARKRKMKYLPPKISIEGHGIKRGLTAVEAAILMEEPMDKIMTMILFSCLKKEAATVKTQEPLELTPASPLPQGLNAYEIDFLDAFQQPTKQERTKKLQLMMVGLIKSVGEKMKGFSRKETVTYYEDIIRRAWEQVEAAATPEVKGQAYEENMDWTMLDHKFSDRTNDVFSRGPSVVYVPSWWWRYDPGFAHSAGFSGAGSAARVPVMGSAGKSSGTSFSVPGANFAASIVNSVSAFSAGVVGNVTDFTSRITNVTNPVPKSSTSYHSSSGGRSCACACACAGCACACAGGGR
jgi:hypothetical protein